MSRSPSASHRPGCRPAERAGAEPEDVLLTVPEVAARLRVCERTVRRLVRKGALPFLRIGRSVRISASDLAAYLRAGQQR